jgi:hypothetical protein
MTGIILQQTNMAAESTSAPYKASVRHMMAYMVCEDANKSTQALLILEDKIRHKVQYSTVPLMLYMVAYNNRVGEKNVRRA